MGKKQSAYEKYVEEQAKKKLEKKGLRSPASTSSWERNVAKLEEGLEESRKDPFKRLRNLMFGKKKKEGSKNGKK